MLQGSIIAAIDGVQNKEFKNAFCNVRPPGHHCNQNKAAGFCILNNVAIGAKYLLNKYKYKKIAIVILMFIMAMVHKIFFMIIKMFYLYQHINILTILELVLNKKKVNLIIFTTYHLPAGTNSEEYLNAFEVCFKKIKRV